MKIGKLLIIGSLLYVIFFNERPIEVSLTDKSNKQIAAIGFKGNPNAENNRAVALQMFTGFFLDPSHQSVYINAQKGIIVHGDTAFSFKVVLRGVNYLLVDYGFGYERDFMKLEPKGNVSIIAENDPLSKTILQRLKTQP